MAIPPRGGRWSAKHDRFARKNGYASWDAWCTELEEELLPKSKKPRGPICGGRKPSDKRPCRGKPMPNGRCRAIHKGNAESGPAHHAYEGKGYSIHFGVRSDDVGRLIESGELVSVREELAVAALIHCDLLGELSLVQADGATFEDLRDSFVELEEAIGKKKNPTVVGLALQVHSDLLASGLNARDLRDEIRKSGDHIARLAKVERKRLETIEESMTRQQILGILAHFVDQARDAVADGIAEPELLVRLAGSLRRLQSPGARDSVA